VFPELVDEGFHIQGARHPLLPTTDEGPVVPMDLIQEPSTLATVISGANMGGKTVALKIAGLFPLMVRCGIMLPAEEGSRIHAFARIMADIGEEQDIRSRVSSFSGHMLRIKAILDTASGGDLVLLDELGGATDPAEGSALAMGIMDELISRGTRVVVTTHLVHLKAYALGRSEVKNVSVEFHPQTLKPTFRLLYDLPGDSHAIATAERIGLPNSVIEAARKYVDAAAGGGSKLIQTLRDKIAEVEARRQELEQDQRELEEELSRTRSGREEILEEFRKEAQKLVRDAEKQISGLVRYLKSGQKKDYFKPHGELKRIKTELEQGLGTRLDKRAQLPPIGSTVHIKSIGKPGIVQALLDRGEVEVSAGKMKMRAAADDLIILAQAPEKKNSSKKKLVRVDIPITNARREVNVIGLRVDEALPVVDRAIDEAVLAGLTSLNVIHGKGTGRLKQAVWDHLSGHSLVKGVHSADLHLGGAGVTVVDLESG
jgi:DNA mismatch repair protein MutS2